MLNISQESHHPSPFATSRTIQLQVGSTLAQESTRKLRNCMFSVLSIICYSVALECLLKITSGRGCAICIDEQHQDLFAK